MPQPPAKWTGERDATRFGAHSAQNRIWDDMIFLDANPNGPDLPAWPRYDSNDSLIHLGSTITSGPDTLRLRYEFLWKAMPATR